MYVWEVEKITKYNTTKIAIQKNIGSKIAAGGRGEGGGVDSPLICTIDPFAFSPIFTQLLIFLKIGFIQHGP